MSTSFMEKFAAESQLLLAAILDQSQDCIKLLNAAGEVEYMNENGRRAMEIGDFSSVAGRPWVDLWPADARKLVENSIDKARRGQRSRFEALCPTQEGRQSWWDVSVAPVYDEQGEVRHILATSRDVTDYMNRRMSDRMRREEAEREADFSDAVAREMRHRLKNQLAVIGSVAKLMARHSQTAAEMSEKLERKIIALARAQDLLTVHREQPITAAEAIEQVLGASGAGDAIEVLSIPHARLGDDAVQQLALILGELQTNSLKYGALRDETGKVILSGRLQGQSLCLHWHEDTGHAVDPPEKSGSGLQLLERLGSSADGRGATEWHSTGPSSTFYVRRLPDSGALRAT